MEKYGTVPKRFTKEWWSYFWDYYKWHTILAVFALILVATTAKQCASRIDYDLTLTVAGNIGFSAEEQEDISTSLAELVDDCDNNGEKHVSLQQIISQNTQTQDAEYEMALTARLTGEFAAGESYLFLFTKDKANTYLNDPQCEGMFVGVEEWADTIPEKSKLMRSKGKAYAINLENSAFFLEKGIDVSGLYLMVRNPRKNELDKDKSEIQFESAKKVANYLISE